MAFEGLGKQRKIQQEQPDQDAILYVPLQHTGRGFWAVVGILTYIVVVGGSAYYRQLRRGLGVTGLNYPVYWGMYIINNIYFIALGYGGTLTSAILRVLRARWRVPITRAAEVMTICALSVGALNIVVDVGRPDRVLNIVLHGQLKSPIVWDFIAISVYMVCSIIYLYLPMIPDFAELQHMFPRRKRLYALLSLGWTGSPRQKKWLERAMDVLAYGMVPIAVGVHTVLSYMFSLTTQPMWHSALMGPYFVMGAVYSGLAGLIIVMALLRRFLHLERYLQHKHFNYMGLFLLAMTSIWTYFTVSEYITTYYGQEPTQLAVFEAKFFGQYAPYFWTQVVLCLVIPLILIFPRWRTVRGTIVASASVIIGMWLERFLILVPTVTHPRLPVDLPYTVGVYHPTGVEWWLMAASVAAIALLYLFFIKLIPIIPVWEIREERERERIEREGPTESKEVFESPLTRRSP